MSAGVERNRPGQLLRGRLRRLLTNVSPRDIAQTLVRREVPSGVETARLSMFGHGQDTRIQNSTVNTTVNYYYTSRSPLETNEQDEAPDEDETVDGSQSSATIRPNDDNSRSPTPKRKATPRDPREVYIDIMITKNRGFPLWIPSPNTFLPPEYRYSGVSIGDVGVLTPEGAFDFIFNVFADASDPIHANSELMESFSPLRPPLRHNEIQRFKENIAGTSVGDDSFERTDNAQDTSKVELTTLESEAAVLMMPEDVYMVRMKNQERLRTYVSAHIAEWYSFIRRTLGRDVSNGDLRVVYGYRKSTAFGIAAISTAKTPTETRLTFCKNDDWTHQSGYKYRWSQIGSADIKTGPEYEESAELMYPSFGTSRRLPENLCLFISTVDAKLSEKTWKSMEPSPVHVVDTVTPSESSSSSSLQPENHSNVNVGHNTAAASARESLLAGSYTNNPSTQVLLGEALLEPDPTIHPSNLLNDVLLVTNPEARISIVCNDNWEDYMDCQDPLEFVSAVLCKSRTATEDGIVHIESSSLFAGDPHNFVGGPSRGQALDITNILAKASVDEHASVEHRPMQPMIVTARTHSSGSSHPNPHHSNSHTPTRISIATPSPTSGGAYTTRAASPVNNSSSSTARPPRIETPPSLRLSISYIHTDYLALAQKVATVRTSRDNAANRFSVKAPSAELAEVNRALSALERTHNTVVGGYGGHHTPHARREIELEDRNGGPYWSSRDSRTAMRERVPSGRDTDGREGASRAGRNGHDQPGGYRRDRDKLDNSGREGRGRDRDARGGRRGRGSRQDMPIDYDESDYEMRAALDHLPQQQHRSGGASSSAAPAHPPSLQTAIDSYFGQGTRGPRYTSAPPGYLSHTGPGNPGSGGYSSGRPYEDDYKDDGIAQVTADRNRRAPKRHGSHRDRAPSHTVHGNGAETSSPFSRNTDSNAVGPSMGSVLISTSATSAHLSPHPGHPHVSHRGRPQSRPSDNTGAPRNTESRSATHLVYSHRPVQPAVVTARTARDDLENRFQAQSAELAEVNRERSSINMGMAGPPGYLSRIGPGNPGSSGYSRRRPYEDDYEDEGIAQVTVDRNGRAPKRHKSRQDRAPSPPVHTTGAGTSSSRNASSNTVGPSMGSASTSISATSAHLSPHPGHPDASHQGRPRSHPPSPVVPGTEFAHLNIHSVPPGFAKEGEDWHAVFDPRSGVYSPAPPSPLGSGSGQRSPASGASGGRGTLRRTTDVNLSLTFQHQSVVCSVQFSGDGRFLATGCNRTTQIYDVSTGAQVCVLEDVNASKAGEDLYIRSIRFSPDNMSLATGAEDRKIRIWDLTSRTIRRVLTGHEQEIYAIDFAPHDGRHIASGSGDKTLRLWDLATEACMVITVDSKGSTTTCTRSGTPPHSAPRQHRGPDGIDTHAYDTTTSEGVSVADTGITSVAFSPDGSVIAAGSLDWNVRVWAVADGTLLRVLRGHTDSVYSVGWTPNGMSIVSGGLDCIVKVWCWDWDPTDLRLPLAARENGRELPLNLSSHKDHVLSVCVSPDGRYVLSGSRDCCVHLWDAHSGALQFSLQGHKNSVISLAVSPLGGMFATGSRDSTTRIWTYASIS